MLAGSFGCLNDPDYVSGTAKTLVFAGEASSADRISELLNGEGLPHIVYHKNRPGDERASALEHMSQQQASTSKVRESIQGQSHKQAIHPHETCTGLLISS